MKVKNWIQTYTGKRVSLVDPEYADICIEDIAQALSRLCRYTGHTKRHYSVAEHSVWVSRRAEKLFRDGSKALPGWALDVKARAVARQGLLHDATEAYLGDVSRPLKHLQGMDAYKNLEKRWQAAILGRYGIQGLHPLVDHVDKELLATEAHQLFPGGAHPDWPDLAPVLYKHPKMGTVAWRAKRLFLVEFARLFADQK